MLKLQFLNKNSLAFTNTYYYGFYGSNDDFDKLDPKEQDMIRRATGVDGYVKSMGVVMKKGYRDKGIELLKKLNTKNLIKVSVEDLYFEFLNSIAEMGQRKAFKENYNKDHEKSGADYNVDSYMGRLLNDFVKSKNSDKKNQSLYIESFEKDKDISSVGTIDLDLAKDSINIAYVSQNSIRSDWDNIIDRNSFKDALLLLKFFEKYFNLNSLIQYIKTHDIKKQYAEISKHIKKGESNVKMGTLPRLNYAELDLKDGRSSFLKKIKRADENTKEALDQATLMFLSILRAEDINIANLPEDLIHDRYMHSLRNDTFYDLKDYIENRRALPSGQVDIKVNGEPVTQKIAEGDIFKTTIDLYKNLKKELSCSELVELLNANIGAYKELYKTISSRHVEKTNTLNDKENKLADYNKLILAIDKSIVTRKLGKNPRFLNDSQINQLKEEKKNIQRKIATLANELNNIKNKTICNPNEYINGKYIKYLKAFKMEYLNLEEDISTASFNCIMEDTIVGQQLFNKLASIYKLDTIIDNQDFLTFHNKCQINSAAVDVATANNWHDLGDGWYGSPVSANFKPTLINKHGMMYEPVDRTIRPIYFTILKKQFNIKNDSNRHIFNRIDSKLNEYLAFITTDSDKLEYYLKWRVENAKTN